MTTLAPDRHAARRRLSPLALFEALTTPHGIDRYLELVHPMLTVRELRAEVVAVTRSTPDTVTLTLRPTRQWRGFEAGQFIGVSVDIDGVRRTRCYSPAGSQHRSDGRIEITVKAHRDGLVSRYLHAEARPGLVVGLTPAEGRFRLPAQRPDKVLLISGGSGITPVLSMLRTLCDEAYAGDITFLHYGTSEADIAYRLELRELARQHPNLNVVLACTGRVGGDLHGYFGRQHLQAVAPWHAQAQTYVCGPPALLTAVRDLFAQLQLAGRLHTEEFVPAPSPGVAGELGGAVRFARSGIETSNAGTTLLAQAEAAGLSPEYGCRMGICFSCTQVKSSGCTRDLRTGDTSSEPGTEVQLCITVPVGDVVVDL